MGIQAMAKVQRGSLLVYKFFDIAEEIDLEGIENSPDFRRKASRFRLTRKTLKAVVVPQPPLTLRLGSVSFEWQNSPYTGSLHVRLYDFGAVSFLLRIPLPPHTDLRGLERWIDFLYDEVFETLCRRYLDELMKALHPYLVQPHVKELTEEYLIYYFERLSVPLETFREQADLPRLLYGEDEDFSPQIRQDLLRHSYSYSTEDLVVIGWEAAIVVEPSGIMEIPDILEFAHVQILELTYYDELLDRELAHAYEQVEHPQRFLWLHIGHYRRVMRRLFQSRLEITEVIERVMNAIKITEDVYFARVYRSAQQVFRSLERIRNIENKIEMFNQFYQFIGQEISNIRLEILEMSILLLILLEVILMLWQ